MRFWIKKENDQDPHVDWKDAYVVKCQVKMYKKSELKMYNS